MAGIAGIIKKNELLKPEVCHASFEKMLSKLKYSIKQKGSNQFFLGNYFGNVIPVSQAVNYHAVFFEEQGIYAVIDGLVFIDTIHKKLVAKNYHVGPLDRESKYIPYLYHHYGVQIVHHLTGWYNIFICDQKTESSLLFNDRLGYLPLYYHDQANVFAFASKIESLLASGLLPDFEFDLTSFAEHLFYNYTLSDYTYIRGIKTIPAATLISSTPDGIKMERYWHVDEFFDLPPLNKKDSIEAINQGLKDALVKVMDAAGRNVVNFSLTGGWDSRVILSCLIPEHRQILNTYSFGAPNADDITVPQLIAEKERFKYTSFLLDQDYLDNHFLKSAADTILLSNGTRNYKRSHYLYAIKQIAAESNLLITGIFGDEVLKVGRPQGGSVISKNAVDFIASGFDAAKSLDRLKKSGIPELLNTPSKDLQDEFLHRMEEVGQLFKAYLSSGQQYFAFRFCLNLRKYFGNEVNSYNDFVCCHSPFIDYDFLKTFAQTQFMASRFDFVDPPLKWKVQSSRLYYEIIRRNHVQLTNYPSSRGFPMKYINTLPGLIRIMILKFLSRQAKQGTDAFNTSSVDIRFQSKLDTLIISDTKMVLFNAMKPEISNLTDFNTLQFWAGIIQKNYT